MLQIGDRAPEVQLKGQHGSLFLLSALQGRSSVVLYFYPKDDTPVCSKEARIFRDRHAEFSGLNAVVVGISNDSIASHKQFAENHRLPFKLLSDVDGAAQEAFGLRTLLGFKARVTFVIDAEGIIRAVVADRLKAMRHVREALAALSRHGLARS